MATEAQIAASRRNAAKLNAEGKNRPKQSKERISALDDSDFEALMRKVAKTMLVPHSEGQAEVLSAEERFLVLCAGRRWGKTKVGAAKILRKTRQKKLIAWWVAPTYKVVKRGYKEVVDQIPEGVLTKPAPPDSVFDAGRSVRLTFKNGSIIEFYSAERPEGMLGGSCDFAILDEAATMPAHVWTQILRPTLADRQGTALFISTPRQRNWFYYIWLRGQSDDPDDAEFRSWRFPSRTNPTIPASEFDDMARDMPQVEYEQEVLAKFISDAASVFRFPDGKTDPITGEEGPSPAIVPKHPPMGQVVMGIDLAKHQDWTVLCGIRADDGKPCYHDRFQQVSWPLQVQRIRTAVAMLIRNGATDVTLLVDSGGPGDVIFDTLEEDGYDVIPINFTTYKEKMVKLLSSDLEQGNAFLHEDQLSEFEHYSYSVTPSGRWKYEALAGHHDDEVSAMLLAHWGRIHEGVPNVQTLSSDGPLPAVDDEGYEPYDDEGYVTDTGIPVERAVPGAASPYDIWNQPGVWG